MTKRQALDADSREAALLRLGAPAEPPAPELDGLTRLALAVTGCSTATISILDGSHERQTSVAGAARRLIPLADSLCARTLAAETPGRPAQAATALHTADASTDLRFADSPMANGVVQIVGCYAAVVLHDVRGRAVGTLSVSDVRIGQLGQSPLGALADLAAQIEHIFELRRQHAQLVEMLAEIDHDARHDVLTGAANRRVLVDRCEQALTRAQRSRRFPTAIDVGIVGLAAMRETFGQDCADALLVEVGRRLQTTLRPTDTVARIGEDTFVALCERLVFDDRRTVVRRVRAALAAPCVAAGIPVEFHVRIGTAVGRADDSVGELLARAEQARSADELLAFTG